MDYTRLLDSIDKDLRSVFLGCCNMDSNDHSMSEDDNAGVSVGARFRQKHLSTIHDILHVVRSQYGVKCFSNSLVWHSYRFHNNRFHRNEKFPEDRLGTEAAAHT